MQADFTLFHIQFWVEKNILCNKKSLKRIKGIIITIKGKHVNLSEKN